MKNKRVFLVKQTPQWKRETQGREYWLDLSLNTSHVMREENEANQLN